MTPNFAATLRERLFAECNVANAPQVAGCVVDACSALAQHVGRLVGDLGVRTLLQRSVHLASAAQPTLKSVHKHADLFESLRTELAGMEASVAVEAGTAVFVEFVTLLQRFIGEALVANLLRQLWPGTFEPGGNKEPA